MINSSILFHLEFSILVMALWLVHGQKNRAEHWNKGMESKEGIFADCRWWDEQIIETHTSKRELKDTFSRCRSSNTTTMKSILLISALSSLSLPLIAAVAIPQNATTTAAADVETSVDLPPGNSPVFSRWRFWDLQNVSQAAEPTTGEPAVVPEIATTEEDAEAEEEVDFSDLGALLGGLQSEDGESPDLSSLAALFGNAFSQNKKGGVDLSNLGAFFDNLQPSETEPQPEPPVSMAPQPVPTADAGNVFLLTSLMRGLGPQLPSSLGAAVPSLPVELLLANGTPDFENLGKFWYVWAFFKQLEEEGDKAKKAEDLTPKIREAVGDLEMYFHANGKDALERFGPLLDDIRKANGRINPRAWAFCFSGPGHWEGTIRLASSFLPKVMNLLFFNCAWHFPDLAFS
jgi:hypothetical protein